MRVGVYFDLRRPLGGDVRHVDVYGEALDLVALADQLGLDDAWASEHHFFDDGYAPQPLLFAAAAAARTTRIRVGTAVLVTPLRHPLHIAEEAAIVDVLSRGRLELGLGAGFRLPEFAAFGADVVARGQALEDAVAAIRRWWTGDRITPGPVQDPVPLWLGATSRGGARRAGRVGAGLLSIDARLLGAYQEGLQEGGYKPSEARMLGLVNVFVATDPDAAWQSLRRPLAQLIDGYTRHALEGTGVLPPAPVDIDAYRASGQPYGVFPPFSVVTPDQAVDLVRSAVDAIPAVGVYFYATFAGVPAELSADHVRLLADVVRPALQDGWRQ